MKRIYKCMMVACLMMVLVGCGKSNISLDTTKGTNMDFSYQLQNAVAFDVVDGNIWVATEDSSTIVCYDENGKQIRQLDLGEGEHTSLCVCGNDLLSFTYTEQAPVIIQCNLENKEIKANTLSSEVTGALSMAVTQKNIYLIYWNEEYDEENEELDIESFDNYVYMGEKAVVIDRETSQITDLEIEHVIGLYQVSQDEIVYYAHDENGYYFTTLDCNTNKFGKRIYNNEIEYTFGFAIDDENKRVISADFAQKRLALTSIEDSETKAEILNQVVVMTGNDIQYDSGYCYVLNNMTKDVIRIDCKEALTENSELVFYHTMSMEEPYSCGYSIRTELLEEDEFALSIMAADESYDLCMIDTGEQKAYEIREKGAFYPLNDVPGVKEYLNSCHEYIKDAAINDTDDIWMLPIAVDIPFVVYNDNTCKMNGIKMEDMDSYEEFLETADRLYEKSDLRQWYSMNGYQMQQDMINQYNEEQIRKENVVNYDTKEFKWMCELMKKHSASEDESLHTWMMEPSEYATNMDEYYEKLLMTMMHYYDISGWDELPYSQLRAKSLPGVLEIQNGHYGTCLCLCVNSNSENLEQALQYISEYCSYMINREDVYLFKDSKNVPFPESQLAKDIYNVYKMGGITYALPENIFWDSYLEYQKEEIDFEQLIDELTRKVNMYLYE